MVSGKERLRLERQWNEMNERMERQKAALTRFAALNTHFAAALLEIANPDTDGLDGGIVDGTKEAALKAQAALDAAEEMARNGNAADQQD